MDSNLKELISTTVNVMDKAGELVGMEASAGKAALANLVNYLIYSGSGEDYGQELGEIFKSLCDKSGYKLMKCEKESKIRS